LTQERITGDLLTLQEAAYQLRVSTKTLRRMVLAGEIGVTKVYNSQRIRKQVLIDYINRKPKRRRK